MMRYLLLAAMTAAFCGSASAEPIEIKGLSLGADLRAEASANNMECRAEGEETRCVPNIPIRLGDRLRTIAGKDVLVAILAGFDEKLGYAMWQIRQDDFDEVRDAFASKYPALKCAESSITNRAGAAFRQTECEYRAGSETLTLQRRAGRVDHSMIELTSREYGERAHRQGKAKAAGAAKSDL
jgi:hypothetical protein